MLPKAASRGWNRAKAAGKAGPGAHTDAGRYGGGHHGHGNRALGAMIERIAGPAALTLPQEPPIAGAASRHSHGPESATAGEGAPAGPKPEPVLCGHCGRTASNGLSCQGICVADSGY